MYKLILLICALFAVIGYTSALPETKWKCLLNNRVVGDVKIWWGHTAGDGKWACNEWVGACKKSCLAETLPETKWKCLLNNRVVGDVKIWWGHTAGDGKWACNEWVGACEKNCWAENN
jgi:hypothetical protein